MSVIQKIALSVMIVSIISGLWFFMLAVHVSGEDKDENKRRQFEGCCTIVAFNVICLVISFIVFILGTIWK